MAGDIGKKTRSGLYWNLSLKIPYEILRFVVSIFVARILDPKDFGIVSIATMVIFYSNSVTNFGFKRALVQRKEITEQHINSVFTVDLAISALLTVVFLLVASPIAAFFDAPECKNVIRVLSVVFVVTTFYDLPYTLLIREVDFKLTSIIDMASEVAMSFITLALAILGFSYWSIVWGRIIPLCLTTAYIVYRVRWKPKIEYHHASIRELFDFGLWSFSRQQVMFFSNRVDRIIIGKGLNITALGLYEKAKSLYQMPIDGIALNVSSVMFSSFSRVQDSAADLRRMFLKSLTVLSVINFPIFLGLYAVTDHFVLVLLGEKWAGMIPSLRILCLGGLFMTFNELISSFLVSIGKYKHDTMRQIVATIFLLILGVCLVRLGIAYVAAAIPLFALLLLCVGFTQMKTSIDVSWKTFMATVTPALISGVLMSAILKVYIVKLFHARTLLNLGVICAIGALIYVVSILVIPSKGLDEIRSSIYKDGRAMLLKIKESFSE